MSGVVLLTRPIDDNVLLANKIEAKGYDVVCQPFLDVVFHHVTLENLNNYSGLIFTSGNAVRSFCNNTEDRSLSVFTVGNSTKDMAIKMGFKDVRSAGGGAQDLLSIISKNIHTLPLLYPRGKHVSYDLSGFNVEEKIVYHTEKKENFLYSVQELIQGGHLTHVLFFSKRTAQAFASVIENTQSNQGLIHTKALCLGSAMIKSLSVLPWKSIEVAQRPNRESIMQLLD